MEWAGALGTLARAVGWQVQGKGGAGRAKGRVAAVRQGVVLSAAVLPGIFFFFLASLPYFTCAACLFSLPLSPPTRWHAVLCLCPMVSFLFLFLRLFSHAPSSP